MNQSKAAKDEDMAGTKGGMSASKGVFSHMKYEHLVAGVSGGVTSSVVLHPLDLIKVRFAGKKMLGFCGFPLEMCPLMKT